MHDLSASDNRLPHARWGCIQHQLPKFAALRGWGVERNGAAGAARARTSVRVAPARQPNQEGTKPHDFTPICGFTWLAVTALGRWQHAQPTQSRGRCWQGTPKKFARMFRAISRTVAHHACPCHVPRARTLFPALSSAWTPRPLRGVVLSHC